VARYVLGANFHKADLSGASRRWSDEDGPAFPPDVTLGYRGVYWAVFTAVYEFKLADSQIRLHDREWRVLKLMAFESDHATTRLGFTDNRNIFVVFILETLNADEQVDLNDEMFARIEGGVGAEQQFVKEAMQALNAIAPKGLIASLVHDRDLPARFLLKLEEDIRDDTLVPAIVTFYFYALLMLWQLEREQVVVPLDTPDDELSGATKMLLRQRQKIINMSRLFFTTNVSNNVEAQRARKQAMQRFNLVKRFDRLPPINDSIERYYEVRTQALLQKQSEQLNRIAFVIALLGLPISVMSMLLSIDTRAQILNEPMGILSRPTVQGFLLTSSIACLTATLILVGIFAVRLSPVLRSMFGRVFARQKKKSFVLSKLK